MVSTVNARDVGSLAPFTRMKKRLCGPLMGLAALGGVATMSLNTGCVPQAATAMVQPTLLPFPLYADPETGNVFIAIEDGSYVPVSAPPAGALVEVFALPPDAVIVIPNDTFYQIYASYLPDWERTPFIYTPEGEVFQKALHSKKGHHVGTHKVVQRMPTGGILGQGRQFYHPGEATHLQQAQAQANEANAQIERERQAQGAEAAAAFLGIAAGIAGAAGADPGFTNAIGQVGDHMGHAGAAMRNGGPGGPHGGPMGGPGPQGGPAPMMGGVTAVTAWAGTEAPAWAAAWLVRRLRLTPLRRRSTHRQAHVIPNKGLIGLQKRGARSSCPAFLLSVPRIVVPSPFFTHRMR
jgi:hypothetical protein